LTIEFFYGAFAMYLLGILFFFEAFLSDEEEGGASYFKTALLWPYVAVKLIVLRFVYGKQEED